MKNAENNLRPWANEVLECSSPEGTFENSPAFQRREFVDYHTNPAGTTESAIFVSRPFGTCSVANSYPAVNCRAILNGSFGTLPSRRYSNIEKRLGASSFYIHS
jgi:hypothetical protein